MPHPTLKYSQKISTLMTRFLLLSVSTSMLLSAVSSKSLDPHVIALKTSLLFAEEDTSQNASSAPVNPSVDLTAPMQIQMQPTTPSDFPQLSSTIPSKSSQTVTVADEITMEQVNTTNAADKNPSSIEIKTRDDNVLSEIEPNDQASALSNDSSKGVLSSSDSVTNAYNDEASILSQASQEIGTCKCGVLPQSDKLDSQRNEFPWSGALFHRTQNNNDSGPPALLMFCGVVLIADRFAISTARCVSGIPFPEFEVWLSEDKIWSDQKPSKGVHKSKVESVVIHPKFDRKILNHDIALLKLSSPVDFSSSNKISSGATTIVPICLPLPTWNSDMSSYTSENATLTSWEKKGRTSYTLSKSIVPIISNEECMSVANKSPVLKRRNDLYNSSDISAGKVNNVHNSSAIKVNENMLCAGDVENGTPESCDTDTGSPLVVDDINGGDGDGRKTLVGLVSWLYGCTSQEELSILYNIIFSDDTQHPQVPGVYTRITNYYSWIMENTIDAQWCLG